MWKGLKKALGHRASKAQKTGPGADVSVRSTSSAGQSSHGAGLFALDMADVDAALSEQQQKKQQQQRQQQPSHSHNNQQLPAPAAALTWAQLQQQLQQQHAVQQLTQQADDSTSKRRAAALQKRVNNSMLDPSTCLYQIKALLSLSTLFEHKLQRDTTQALQQQPSNLVSSLQALAQWQQAQAQAPPPPPPSKQQQLYSGGGYEQQQQSAEFAAGALCAYCQGLAADGSQDSFCSCAGGGPACLRAPSATAASTAHVALQLAAWGYRVIVRKVVHSKAYWTKSMDNTFIVALDSSSGNHVEYIVDPHFQEAFNVGVMSDNYRAVWQSLPRVFVGMPCQLQSAVQLLCEEMELSFLEAGRPCPPWRGWAATINRWMSDQFVDILVPEPGAGSEEVAEYMARCTQLAAGGCGPGSSASSSSTATRGSSNALSTCSPPGGTVSQQRLGDKVHVSSVLSSVSAGGQRRVPEPLQKQLGFVAEAEAQQQQQLHADAADLAERRVSISSSGSSECGVPVAQHLAVQPGLCQEQQQQEQHACDLADTVLGRRSSSSSSSCSSSSGGGASRSGSSTSKGRSLLTAQMQFRQQLQQRQQQQQPLQFAQGTTPAAAALQQGWLQHQQQQHHHHQQQEQLLLMLQQQQQQQQQQLLLQQLQQGQAALAVQQPHAHAMQLLQLQQQQQQQQPGLAGCAALLPVVHTVRPCGAAVPAAAAPAAAVPASAAAMHAAAMQQLLPVQQRLQLHQQHQQLPALQAVPQALHLVRPVQPQQQQQGPQPSQQQQVQPHQLQLQASMHSSPEEQPKLLRLIPRSKAT